ncbi:MAG TPA: hypothetical protein VEK75_08140 [Xanthobacteraceae bacterium]|nr:hypothetical protein [Xanthobacteraceae bacterium]
MLRIRIFAAAAALILTALLSHGAAAQTTVGKPFALLAGLNPPHQIKAVHARAAHKAHKKLAARKSPARPRLAAKHHQELAVEPAQPQTPPAALPEATSPAADAAPDSAPPADAASNDDPTQVVVAGQTVQIAPPDRVNAIDLAADRADAGAAASPAADAAAPTIAADSADAAAPASVLAAPFHQAADTAPVGSASWIAQVLAALGGAVTAGVVAWFLIGAGPVRTYG